MKNIQILLSLSMLFLISTLNGQSSGRVEAPNAKSVIIAEKGSSNSIGNFQKMSSGLWESSIGSQTASYVESGRDQWSIYLKASNTSQNVMLNLWTKKVLFDGVEKYAVLEVSADAIPDKPTTPPVVATPNRSALSSGYVRFQNNWYKNNYIHNQNGKIEQGPIEPNSWSAHWKVIPVHSGWVRIQNRWHEDQYLHNQNGRLEVGKIQNNWASAMWKLVPVNSDWVRIQNSWYKDHYIHNENGKIELGPIQPNWASALWKVDGSGTVDTPPIESPKKVIATTPATPVTPTTPVTTTTPTTPTTPTGPTWGFKNDSNFPLEISVDGKVIGTLRVSQKVQSLPVKIGDEVSVLVIEEDQKLNRDKWGYPTVLINDATKNPLRIVVKAAYTFDDVRKGLRDDYIVNFHGIDLTEFNPIDVAGSFKTSSTIFDGLRIGTYMYYQSNDGTYLPNGFGNTGKTNSGSGNYTEKTIQGQDKMKEAWSVGASVGAEIPLDQAGQFVAKNKVSFNYGESEVENSSESDVFITSSDRKVIYNLELISLDDVILHKDFIQAVEGIRSMADANNVVEKYGTHYADNVIYGGRYHTMIRIHEDSYYTANTKDWDLTADIKVSKSGGPETTTRTPNSDKGYTDTKGGGGSSGVGGTFSFKNSKAESHEEVYGNIESEYWYAGGTGNIDSWSVDEGNALAVSVGNLIYISELVKPNIFKTALTESDLKPKRDLLKKAIELKLKDMKYLEMPKPYRSFHYRIKSIEYVHYNDDANTRIKGNIKAHILSNGKEIDTKTLWERKDWVEDNTGGLTDRKELSLVRNSLDKNSWVVGRQEGTYVGTGEDAKMKFNPLQIKFSGSITEKDDCCFNTGHDVLKIKTKGGAIYPLKDSGKKQYYSFELDHFFTHVEKMRLKVTIEIVPLIGF